MSSREFAEWMAYYSLDPFGDERADLRAASITAMIANSNRDRKRHPSPFTPDQFMPKFDRPAKKQQTWQEQLEVVRMYHAAMGGK